MSKVDFKIKNNITADNGMIILSSSNGEGHQSKATPGIAGFGGNAGAFISGALIIYTSASNYSHHMIRLINSGVVDNGIQNLGREWYITVGRPGDADGFFKIGRGSGSYDFSINNAGAVGLNTGQSWNVLGDAGLNSTNNGNTRVYLDSGAGTSCEGAQYVKFKLVGNVHVILTSSNFIIGQNAVALNDNVNRLQVSGTTSTFGVNNFSTRDLILSSSTSIVMISGALKHNQYAQANLPAGTDSLSGSIVWVSDKKCFALYGPEGWQRLSSGTL